MRPLLPRRPSHPAGRFWRILTPAPGLWPGGAAARGWVLGRRRCGSGRAETRAPAELMGLELEGSTPAGREPLPVVAMNSARH
jgi:hypothetical protein